MMGRLNHDQEQFFYSFRLDEAVPNDHPVREVVAAVLDLSWVHSELAAYYVRSELSVVLTRSVSFLTLHRGRPQFSSRRWPESSGNEFGLSHRPVESSMSSFTFTKRRRTSGSQSSWHVRFWG
jgi:hypothetical protein